MVTEPARAVGGGWWGGGAPWNTLDVNERVLMYAHVIIYLLRICGNDDGRRRRSVHSVCCVCTFSLKNYKSVSLYWPPFSHTHWASIPTHHCAALIRIVEKYFRTLVFCLQYCDSLCIQCGLDASDSCTKFSQQTPLDNSNREHVVPWTGPIYFKWSQMKSCHDEVISKTFKPLMPDCIMLDVFVRFCLFREARKAMTVAQLVNFFGASFQLRSTCFGDGEVVALCHFSSRSMHFSQDLTIAICFCN